MEDWKVAALLTVLIIFQIREGECTVASLVKASEQRFLDVGVSVGFQRQVVCLVMLSFHTSLVPLVMH